MSIASEFLKVAKDRASEIAIVDPHGDWTYGELENEVRKMAYLIQTSSKSKNVGILLPTGGRFSITFLACQLSGNVVVPINFLLADSQILHIRNDANLETIVTCESFRETAESLNSHLINWDELEFSNSNPLSDFRQREDEELATILYTSGTTGLPKGVMLTQKNFLSNVASVTNVMGINEQDVFLGMLPLFHSFGLTATLLLPLLVGCKVVFLEKFHPGTAAECIKTHRVSVLLAVASMYRFLVHAVQKTADPFPSLRLCISGGEPLDDVLADAFEETFKFPLLNGYGLTETSPVVAINILSRAKRGSIGPPLPEQEVRIVGEDGMETPVGKDGELWIRGPNIMQGYYNLPEETAAVLDDEGWFKTGDQAREDDDGYLYITGRLKDLIKSSGEYIAPFEIEYVIAQHPAVYEVAVIGIPDTSRGEAPKAFVALKPESECSSNELLNLCRGKLARFKVPKEIEFRDELPHGSTGKVMKRLLRSEI